MGQTFELGRANGTARGGPFQDYLSELDDMRARIVGFAQVDPGDILVALAGISARLAEIRAVLMRENTQKATALRTREVDPLCEEVDRQFRIWSRRIAWMEWEYKVSTGGI